MLHVCRAGVQRGTSRTRGSPVVAVQIVSRKTLAGEHSLPRLLCVISVLLWLPALITSASAFALSEKKVFCGGKTREKGARKMIPVQCSQVKKGSYRKMYLTSCTYLNDLFIEQYP